MADADLRVICGPTAAGKSSIAMALAARVGGLIVSADSRQVYRGFDVGTAKPTRVEQGRVPHRGIDVAEPTETYSAARWSHEAVVWIAEAHESSRPAIVVGGTGFYLRALFEPLFDSPPCDEDRRRDLLAVLDSMPTDELRRWCEALDPARARLGRTQLLRAVETSLLLGERLSDLHERRARAPLHSARYLVVDPGPALAGRIAERVDAMLASGWIDEVRALSETVPPDAPAWKSTGYRAVRALVDGEADVSTVRERIVIETRQYAKRQRTWFRHQLEASRVTRLDPTAADADEVVQRWWMGEGTA